MRGRLYVVLAQYRFVRTSCPTAGQRRTGAAAAAVARFRPTPTGPRSAAYDEIDQRPVGPHADRLQQQVISRARGAAVGVTPEEWWLASTSELDHIRTIEQELLEDAVARPTGPQRRAAHRPSWPTVGDRARHARRTAAVLAHRPVDGPLAAPAAGPGPRRGAAPPPEAIQRLRTLPRGETVTVDTTTRVRSTDEIGEVADAFTAVHRSAVSLAVEQAVMRRNVNSMFVNLARRSQTLVERQLQLLDQLESAETDPDQLANLFRLDHLATRMRRNDENLLVLAGSEATRRWAQPVSLSAVTLAAMAEIEQYARIRHDVATDVFVVGHAVSDIVHLLAELLENATTFSPPDTVVTVAGWPAKQTSEATIVIEDRGLGMTESGLVDANDRVSAPIAIDVAASERMGLVVVGHLAARHGVQVELQGTNHGVRAQVWIRPNCSRRPRTTADRTGPARYPPWSEPRPGRRPTGPVPGWSASGSPSTRTRPVRWPPPVRSPRTAPAVRYGSARPASPPRPASRRRAGGPGQPAPGHPVSGRPPAQPVRPAHTRSTCARPTRCPARAGTAAAGPTSAGRPAGVDARGRGSAAGSAHAGRYGGLGRSGRSGRADLRADLRAGRSGVPGRRARGPACGHADAGRGYPGHHRGRQRRVDPAPGFIEFAYCWPIMASR